MADTHASDPQPSEQPSPQYFHIGPERAQEILQAYQSFKQDHDEFCFPDVVAAELRGPDDEAKQSNRFYVDLAQGMSQLAGLDFHFHFSGRGLGGRLKGLIKKVLGKLLRPLLKQALGQQAEMNRHTVLLAQAVVALEARVALLEQQKSAEQQLNLRNSSQ